MSGKVSYLERQNVAHAVRGILAADWVAQDRLAKALFEKEEALLPECETWEAISDGDRSHYKKCAMAVLYELETILAEQFESAR